MPFGKRRGYSDCIRGNRASGLTISTVRFHPLAALLLMAAVIRLPLAFWPNIIHADEIFQYLEPAWRMLGHEGIVSWEWSYGMRGWLLPSLMAGPVALGDWVAPGGTGVTVDRRQRMVFRRPGLANPCDHCGLRGCNLVRIRFLFTSYAERTVGDC